MVVGNGSIGRPDRQRHCSSHFQVLLLLLMMMLPTSTTENPQWLWGGGRFKWIGLEVVVVIVVYWDYPSSLLHQNKLPRMRMSQAEIRGIKQHSCHWRVHHKCQPAYLVRYTNWFKWKGRPVIIITGTRSDHHQHGIYGGIWPVRNAEHAPSSSRSTNVINSRVGKL